VPAKGDRLSGYGELLDRARGRKVGEFSAAYFALESPMITSVSRNA
jgi:hypothetical protein